MGRAWSMDLTGHEPRSFTPPEPGQHLAEVSGVEFQPKDSKNTKGNRIRFTFKVTDPNDTSHGRTISEFFYVIDDEFAGSDGHKAVTLDRWVLMLRAIGVKAGAMGDVKQFAERLVGRKVGLQTDLRTEDNPPPERADNPRKYGDVKAYIPAAAMGESIAADEPDDEPINDTADDAEDVTPDDIDLSDIA